MGRAEARSERWLPMKNRARLAGDGHGAPGSRMRGRGVDRDERGVRPDVIERVQNHVPAKIARTYNRASYDSEKRQALATLGDLIESAALGKEIRSNLVRLAWESRLRP